MTGGSFPLRAGGAPGQTSPAGSDDAQPDALRHSLRPAARAELAADLLDQGLDGPLRVGEGLGDLPGPGPLREQAQHLELTAFDPAPAPAVRRDAADTETGGRGTHRGDELLHRQGGAGKDPEDLVAGG